MRLPLESTRTLINRVHAGDREALDRLYDRYLPPLQRWASMRLPFWARDLLQTDDVVQDALMRSLRNVDRFVPERTGSFHAYLRRSVMNRIRDEMRRVRAHPSEAIPARGLIAEDASPVEAAIGREALDAYENALAMLSESDREAVLARVELGLSYSEIADMLGKPSPDAARMAVSRAVVRLARAMSNE